MSGDPSGVRKEETISKINVSTHLGTDQPLSEYSIIHGGRTDDRTDWTEDWTVQCRQKQYWGVGVREGNLIPGQLLVVNVWSSIIGRLAMMQ